MTKRVRDSGCMDAIDSIDTMECLPGADCGRGLQTAKDAILLGS